MRDVLEAVSDGAGRSISVRAESATPHEVPLVQGTLAENGVEMIAKYLRNRDSRPLARPPLKVLLDPSQSVLAVRD